MALTTTKTVTDENGRELTAHGTISFPVGCYHDIYRISPTPWH